MAAPLISVLVTAFNQPEALDELLTSLADQTFRDFEVVIVNDAGCPLGDICALYPDLSITLHERATNAGQTACLNQAVGLARGTRLLLLDNDDRLWEGHLERMQQAIADADLVFADAEVYRFSMESGTRVPTQRRLLAHRFDPDMLRQYLTFTPSGVLYRRRLHDELGLFDETLRSCYQDWDWVLRVAAANRIRRVPLASVYYAFGDHNVSSNPTTMQPSLGYLKAKHGLGDVITTNFERMLDDPILEAVRVTSERVWDGRPITGRRVSPIVRL